MTLLTGSLIRRHLRNLPSFHPLNGSERFERYERQPNEELIGWYQPSGDENCLVFTSDAIVVIHRDSVGRIPLNAIVEYELPKTKTAVQAVEVRLADQTRRSIPISGVHGAGGRYSDAWSLVQILHMLVRLSK